MSTLTDRYVAATVRLVPRSQRKEIARELRASIGDAVEQRVEHGEAPDQAAFMVLSELGDPVRLSTNYIAGATSLIGPATYPSYKRVLRWACLIVLPIVYLVNAIGHWVRGDNPATAIFAPLGITLLAALILLVAITALFVLLDRRSNADHWTSTTYLTCESRPDHVGAVAEMALAMQAEVPRRADPSGRPLQLRIGIDTGPVKAGVIGTSKFSYDLWGDTVNTASRMQSHGVTGCTQVTERTYQRLRDGHQFQRRGPIPVRGMGEMITYFLLGRNR